VRPRRRRRLPLAPRNVRLVDGAGGQHPVELAYQGLDRGVHIWVATTITPIDWQAGGVSLTAEEIPGRTVVRLQISQP